MTRFVMFALNYAPEPTGNAPYTTAYAEALVHAGHEVVVISGYPHYPAWTSEDRRWYWSTDCRSGVKLIRVPHLVPSRPTALQRLGLEASYGLATLVPMVRLEDFGASIGVVPSLSGGLAAQLVARLRNRPLGLLMQDLMSAAAAQSGVPGGRSNGVVNAVSFVERRIVNGAHVATVARGFVEPITMMRAASITYLPNFSVLPAARGQKAIDARQRLGIPPDAFVVGYSGNLGYKQDFGTVMEAARQLRPDPSIMFVIVGDGSQRRLVESEVEAGRVNAKRLPIQPAEDVLDILRSFDLLLAPQRATDMDMSVPSKLVAYFAAGRPILAAASRQSETAEQIALSEAGVVIEPGDSGAMVKAILELRSEPSRRAILGSAGARYARSALGRVAALERFVTWAEHVAQGASPRNQTDRG